MRCKKFCKVVLSWAMRVMVFALLGPFTVLYHYILRLGLAIKIWKLQGKRSDTISENFGRPRPSDLTEWTELSESERLEFEKNRSRTYIDQMTYGALWELSDLACGRQRVPLIPNYALHHVLFNSVFSYGLTREGKSLSDVAWRFSFEQMGEYKLFRDFQWDVSEILILKTGRLNIRDRTGKIHTPRCKTWPLAKAHVQAQLTHLAPGLARSHVHFILPTVISCEIRKSLLETSVLRQLLEPHIQFTHYINHKTFDECLSDSTPSNMSDRILRPWLKSMPNANADFIAGIQKKCEKYYTESCSLVPNLDDEIPYQCFLKVYYRVFHEFVTELAPLLKSDYEILRTAMIEYLPGVARENMVDILTGFLWNSCVAHHCDHESYLQQWGRRYGCMSIRTPLVKSESQDEKIAIKTISNGKINAAFVPDIESLKNDNKNTNNTNNDVVIETYHYPEEDGAKFFRSIDVCRTKCFLRTFAQYNKNPKVNMTLFDTEYGFTDKLAQTASANFLTEIKDLSSILKQRGEAIVMGENFIRSVCY